MKRKQCTEESAISTAFYFFNPRRKKRVKPKPTDISSFIANGGNITKCPTPEYSSTYNSKYRQKDIDFSRGSRSRFSQNFEDKKK